MDIEKFNKDYERIIKKCEEIYIKNVCYVNYIFYFCAIKGEDLLKHTLFQIYICFTRT